MHMGSLTFLNMCDKCKPQRNNTVEEITCIVLAIVLICVAVLLIK